MSDAATTTSVTLSVPVEGLGSVPVTLSDRGSGRTILLLHGGGGPLTVNLFADQMAAERPARILTPIHPGFSGSPRAEGLVTVGGLAALYAALLEELDLSDVTVVGNSIGGWIAAEMAILGSKRVMSYVLVDAVGIEVPGHPVVDFYSLTPRQVAEHSYHDPDKFGIDPSKLPPAVQQAMAGNREALTVYAGSAMTDPTLAGRLGAVTTPALVLWGDADRIADADFGRALAEAIPGARFRLLSETGHLPQIETPAQLMDAIWEFAG